jgi:HK97 family phage prohead protease
MTDTERRDYGANDIEVRVEGDSAFIKGYAAKFNTLSSNLGGFVEQVAPSAFEESVNREHDVRALFNHDPNIVLGRTRSGTLKLRNDDIGLEYEAEGNMKKRSVRDLVADIERQDVDQSSFGFRTLEDDWSTTDEDYPLRTLIRVRLYDVSPATIPAYPDTTVAIRSLADITEQPIEELVEAAGRDELRSFLLETTTTPPGPPGESDSEPHALVIARRDLWERKGLVANPPL